MFSRVCQLIRFCIRSRRRTSSARRARSDTPDDPTTDPIDGETKAAGGEPQRPLLARLQDAFPVAWKHDELFRYALILSLLAWLVVLFHIGSGTTR